MLEIFMTHVTNGNLQQSVVDIILSDIALPLHYVTASYLDINLMPQQAALLFALHCINKLLYLGEAALPFIFFTLTQPVKKTIKKTMIRLPCWCHIQQKLMKK